MHGVFDSYLQNSMKESEQGHRSDNTPIGIVDLGFESDVYGV